MDENQPCEELYQCIECHVGCMELEAEGFIFQGSLWDVYRCNNCKCTSPFNERPKDE